MSYNENKISIKDAQCAETNEKLIFRFLFFELLMILFTIFKCFSTIKGQKLCLSEKMRNVRILSWEILML